MHKYQLKITYTLIFSIHILDLREEICYMQFDKGRCLKPFTGLYRKMLCCCSLGRAWGNNCEQCPRPGTGTYLHVDIKIKN